MPAAPAVKPSAPRRWRLARTCPLRDRGRLQHHGRLSPRRPRWRPDPRARAREQQLERAHEQRQLVRSSIEPEVSTRNTRFAGGAALRSGSSPECRFAATAPRRSTAPASPRRGCERGVARLGRRIIVREVVDELLGCAPGRFPAVGHRSARPAYRRTSGVDSMENVDTGSSATTITGLEATSAERSRSHSRRRRDRRGHEPMEVETCGRAGRRRLRMGLIRWEPLPRRQCMGCMVV